MFIGSFVFLATPPAGWEASLLASLLVNWSKWCRTEAVDEYDELDDDVDKTLASIDSDDKDPLVADVDLGASDLRPFSETKLSMRPNSRFCRVELCLTFADGIGMGAIRAADAAAVFSSISCLCVGSMLLISLRAASPEGSAASRSVSVSSPKSCAQFSMRCLTKAMVWKLDSTSTSACLSDLWKMLGATQTDMLCVSILLAALLVEMWWKTHMKCLRHTKFHLGSRESRLKEGGEISYKSWVVSTFWIRDVENVWWKTNFSRTN